MNHMHTVGKRIIMIPVMIVILALLFRFAGFLPQHSSKSSIRQIPTIPQNEAGTQGFDTSLAPTSSVKTASRIDLKGPLACDYTSADVAVTVRVHNKNILIKYQQTEKPQQLYLLNSGILYLWQYGTYQGQKIDVSQYMSMAEVFSSFLTPDIVLSFLPQQEGQRITQEQIDALKQTCEEIEIDDSVFIVPQTVTFTLTDISDLQQPAQENQE